MSGQPSEPNALSFEQIFTEERLPLSPKHLIDNRILENLEEIIKQENYEKLLLVLFYLSKSDNDKLSENHNSLYNVLEGIKHGIKFSKQTHNLADKDLSNDKESKKKQYQLLIEESYQHVVSFTVTLDNLKEIIKKNDNEKLLLFLFYLSKSDNDKLSENSITLYDTLKNITPNFKFSKKIDRLADKIKKPKDPSNDKKSKKKLYRLLIEESYKHVVSLPVVLENLKERFKNKDNTILPLFLFYLYKSGNDKLSEDPKSLRNTLKDIIPDINFSKEINDLVDKDLSNDRESKKELYRLLIEESYKHVLYSIAHEAQLVGLAFSGGGIRSATFNLGVLQGMAELGILSIVDYLATVSGGGYIGSWLIAWIKKERNKIPGKTGLDAVIEKLKPDRRNHDNKKEPEEIHRLRDYSNYLTPRKGFLGTDMWLLLTTYLRNSFFNLLILVLVLFSIITLIHFILISLYHPEAFFHCYINIACWVSPFIFIIICISFLSGSTEQKWLPFVLVGVALFLSYGLWKGYYLEFSKDVLIWVFTFCSLCIFSSLFFIINKGSYLRLLSSLLIIGSLCGYEFLHEDVRKFVEILWQYPIKIYLLLYCIVSIICIVKHRKRLLWISVAGGIAGFLFFSLSYWVQNVCITASDFKEADFESEFNKKEFAETYLIKELCEIIKQDINETQEVESDEARIKYLNKQLEKNDLYEKLKGKHDWELSIEAKDLREETKCYREKDFSKLKEDQKKNVKRFNRLCLRDIYGTIVPDDQSKKLDYQRDKYIGKRPAPCPQFDIPISRIQSFKQWIQIPSFYDSLEKDKRYKDRGFFSILDRLSNETEGYRNKEFYDLDDRQQGKIKKLNRLLIKEILPEECPDCPKSRTGRLAFACFGMPTVILIILFAGALWFLLARDAFTEDERKGLGNFAVSLLGWTALTTALFAVTIFGKEISGKIADWFQYFATFAWVHVMIVMSGLLQKFIPGYERKGAKWGFKIAIALGMCIIISGAIIISAWLPHIFKLDQTPNWKLLFFTAIIPLGVAFFMAWWMNINSLSLHTLYKDRLKRAYLGAPENKGKGNAHSNEGTYDLEINNIITEGYDGPYPIINATLNLTKGAELAWQQRKAVSFVFTLQHYGYAPNHRHAEEHDKNMEKVAYRSWDDTGGFKLSDAMAISGAAASPSMGYRSSGALAFIMTVFNVRLGQWFGNPRHKKTYKEHAGPTWRGLWYLLNELFGWSDDRGKYVYLSDGGHFENLGIYELVRRRCRYIVACDVGEDPDMEFGDLANAIEKCRTDFGIHIDIDVDQMKKDKESGNCGSHYAIGTIEYTKVDSASSSDGILVYIKASLTGDESLDIKSYKTQNDTFPHQTTLDQMFDESQFEAYRTLGIHVIKDVFDKVSHGIWDSNNVEKFFYDLSSIYQRETASIYSKRIT